MSRAIASVLSSLACVCWIADAVAVGVLPALPNATTRDPVLVVHPALPTPSTPIVIEGRISAPFDIGDHCMYVFKATPEHKWFLSNAPLNKFATDGANYFTVDLGTLDAGTYMFTYTDSDCLAHMYTEWSVEFTVSTSGTVTVVEYFNAALGHYFITADATEIAKLDDGTIGGWSRTGETFHALPIETATTGFLPRASTLISTRTTQSNARRSWNGGPTSGSWRPTTRSASRKTGCTETISARTVTRSCTGSTTTLPTPTIATRRRLRPATRCWHGVGSWNRSTGPPIPRAFRCAYRNNSGRCTCDPAARGENRIARLVSRAAL
jgi:hypothetical protein